MDKPKIHNLKMLYAIHKTVMDYSGNQELADSVWHYLIANSTNPPQVRVNLRERFKSWLRNFWSSPTGQDGYSQT